MAKYGVTRSNTALSTTNDLLTLITATARKGKIYMIEVDGMGTVSAANEVIVARSSGGVTAGGAIAPEPIERDIPATASMTTATTWATQPTLDDILMRMGVNANGGINRWVAPQGKEIEIRNAETLSFRSGLGTSPVSITVHFDE